MPHKSSLHDWSTFGHNTRSIISQAVLYYNIRQNLPKWVHEKAPERLTFEMYLGIRYPVVIRFVDTQAEPLESENTEYQIALWLYKLALTTDLPSIFDEHFVLEFGMRKLQDQICNIGDFSHNIYP